MSRILSSILFYIIFYIIAFLSFFSVPRLNGILPYYYNSLSSNERPRKNKDSKEKELRKTMKIPFLF